jgi:hypothetical protein
VSASINETLHPKSYYIFPAIGFTNTYDDAISIPLRN